MDWYDDMYAFKKEMKPFQCGKCLNNFGTNAQLKFHTELVHSKGEYQCAKCDFTCISIGQITLHNQKHIREKYLNTFRATKSTSNQSLNLKKSIEESDKNNNFPEECISTFSEVENNFVLCNANKQIGEACTNDEQFKINSDIKIKETSDDEGDSYFNDNYDFIGFENEFFEIENVSKSVKPSEPDLEVVSSCTLTNSNIVEDNLPEKEQVKYIKALDCIKNYGEPMDKKGISDGNFCDKIANTYDVDKFESMTSFLDLINNASEKCAKISDINSPRGKESEHLYTKKYTESQIESINSIIKSTNDKIITNEQMNKLGNKKMRSNNCTGTTKEVEKLMFKVQRVHKQFRCPICRRLYQNSSLVKRHLLIHTGEKPFRCTKCDCAFNQKIQLQKHMKNIHNEGLFKCMHCNETFVQQIHLNRHIVTHTGAVPYPCNICLKQFSLERDVRKHMREKHDSYLTKQIKIINSNNTKVMRTENEADLTNNYNNTNDSNSSRKGFKMKKSSKTEHTFDSHDESKTSPYSVLNPPCLNTDTVTYKFHLNTNDIDSDSELSLPDINM